VSAFVIDVNVAVVANGASRQADTACVLACIQILKELRENVIAIDDRDHILSEYRGQLSMSGQPGVGDEFMQWIHQNQCTESICERVAITPYPEWGFEEFPHDDRLGRVTDPRRFDRSDRKYVAVALASRQSPTILNAVDSDWSEYRDALLAHGVVVEELCPNCLREYGDQSFGDRRGHFQ